MVVNCGVCGGPYEMPDWLAESALVFNRMLEKRKQTPLTQAEVAKCPACRGVSRMPPSPDYKMAAAGDTDAL